MPKRVKCNEEQVLSLFNEVKSGREVARRLNLHENTVYGVLKRTRGLCLTCGKQAYFGRKYCKVCLQHIAQRQKQKRLARRRQGLCEMCDKPYELPSRHFCKEHWQMRRAAARKNDARRKLLRGTPLSGIPSQSQRERHIKKKYGIAAVELWRELNASCVLCHVNHKDRAVCIHHIDCNDQNHAKENLTLLCSTCHRMVHILIEHPAPNQSLDWLIATYPTIFN